MPHLRRLVRSLRARRAIARLLVLAHGLRLSARPLGVAVVYHRVDRVPTDPATHLVPALSTVHLRTQINLLKACFELVTASQLAARVRCRRRGERIPLAITFDDDLECHARLSAPLLLRAGAAATFFLSGAAISGQRAYWWDHLQAVVDSGTAASALRRPGIPSSLACAWSERPESIHEVAEAVRVLDPATRAAVTRLLADAGRAPKRPAEALPVEGIRALSSAGFEIGFHTAHHDSLPPLDDDRLMQALTEGREQLAQAAEQPLVTIAYPHGRADERVARAARAAGYSAGFTTRAAAIEPGQDEMLLGRVECSYGPAADLARRLREALHGAGG